MFTRVFGHFTLEKRHLPDDEWDRRHVTRLHRDVTDVELHFQRGFGENLVNYQTKYQHVNVKQM